MRRIVEPITPGTHARRHAGGVFFLLQADFLFRAAGPGKMEAPSIQTIDFQGVFAEKSLELHFSPFVCAQRLFRVPFLLHEFA